MLSLLGKQGTRNCSLAPCSRLSGVVLSTLQGAVRQYLELQQQAMQYQQQQQQAAAAAAAAATQQQQPERLARPGSASGQATAVLHPSVQVLALRGTFTSELLCSLQTASRFTGHIPFGNKFWLCGMLPQALGAQWFGPGAAGAQQGPPGQPLQGGPQTPQPGQVQLRLDVSSNTRHQFAPCVLRPAPSFTA